MSKYKTSNRKMMQVFWSNDKSLPTAKSLGINGYSNQYKDHTYRVREVELDEYNMNNIFRLEFTDNTQTILSPDWTYKHEIHSGKE